MSRVSFAVVLVAAAGCQRESPRYPVAGSVTVGGVPAAAATVVFEDAAAGTTDTGLVDAGRFAVRSYKGVGLPPGTYRVAVLPRAADTDDVPLAGQVSKAAPPPGPAIPGKYADPSTSGLTAEVRGPDDPPLTFDLTP